MQLLLFLFQIEDFNDLVLVLPFQVLVEVLKFGLANNFNKLVLDLADLTVRQVDKQSEERSSAILDAELLKCVIDAVIWRAVIDDFSAETTRLKFAVSAVYQSAGHGNIQVHQRDHVLCVNHREGCLVLLLKLSELSPALWKLVGELNDGAILIG